MEFEEIWKKGLALVEKKVGSATYELWFKPILVKNLREDVVTLELPNRFYQEWIEDHYPDAIGSALPEISGKGFKFKYRYAEEQDKDLEKIQKKLTSRRQRLASKGIYLNPKYTFDSFVVGPSTQFAHAAAMAVSESIGKIYNPLFIYGGVGLGKTHLINAIGNKVIDKYPEYAMLYVSAEQFTNEVVSAIRHERMGEFREKYRNNDLFLLDDVQFIAGKERTQDEFFHTFNALYEKQKQIVISSDRPPKEISAITDRLKSRFAMGLIADIQSPDTETKMAILQKKADAERIKLDNDVAYFLATNRPVGRHRASGAVEQLAGLMRSAPWFWLAMSPEGTRGFRDHLRSGFYHLALAMQVPVGLAFIDYGRKSVGVRDYVHMSGDVAADLQLLREFYADRHGLYPEKAATIAFREAGRQAGGR